MNGDEPRSAVVGVAGNGRCSGVVVGPNFVLTSDHCVNAVGTEVAIVDAFGTQVVGRVCAKSATTRLALLCCMPIRSSSVAIAATAPAAGTLVEIESRPPRQQAWRASSRVSDASPGELTIHSISDRRLPDSGDSGSPAFVDDTLVGVLQEVRGPCGEVAVYTSMAPAANWVHLGMQQHAPSCLDWIRRAGRAAPSR